MRKTFLHLGASTLLAAVIAALPAHALAQTNNQVVPNKPTAAEKAPTAKTEKKPTTRPFHGKLAALDQTAKSITVGKRTFFITSDTKIFKAGKPATLGDGVVGETASGGFNTAENGKLIATKINFGPKMDSPSAGQKREPLVSPGSAKK
ncbi:MAG TPA: hypothetical protein VNT26_05480 [Candidatus Sulfotelmatobacter sp.]|nr:hypothetical protein [Candidatus Sulfotelmatobacter sp.]